MRVTTLPTFAAEVSAHKITRWLKVSIPCLATRKAASIFPREAGSAQHYGAGSKAPTAQISTLLLRYED